MPRHVPGSRPPPEPLQPRAVAEVMPIKGSLEDSVSSRTGSPILDKWDRCLGVRFLFPSCPAHMARLGRFLGQNRRDRREESPGQGWNVEGERVVNKRGEAARRGGGGRERGRRGKPEAEPAGLGILQGTQNAARRRAQGKGAASAPGRPPQPQPQPRGPRAGEQPASRSGRGPPHAGRGPEPRAAPGRAGPCAGSPPGAAVPSHAVPRGRGGEGGCRALAAGPRWRRGGGTAG